MKIYIAAPYTKGDVAQNVRAAIQAAEEIVKKGHIPYIPHLTHFWHLLFPHPIEFWYEYDMVWLVKCDALLRIPGESYGADLEVSRATQLEKLIYYSTETIPEAK